MTKPATERLTFSGGIDFPVDELGRAAVPHDVRAAIGMMRDALNQCGHPNALLVSFGDEAPARIGRPRGSRNKAAPEAAPASDEGE